MKPSHTADAALMQRIAAGDALAFAELYRKHYARVRAFVCSRKLGLPSADVEDIVQDVCSRVQAKAALYQPTGRVISWILTIAQNLLRDVFKAYTRRIHRETNYALARPPQGGAVDSDYALSGAATCTVCTSDLIDAWQGGYPPWRTRRPRRRDRIRLWMNGNGDGDSVTGMFRHVGLVHHDDWDEIKKSSC